MAKRFFNTELHNNPWYMDLKPKHKCFWHHILMTCNHSGLWQVNFKAASFFVNDKLAKEECLEIFKDQIVQVDGGKIWFIPSFIYEQYGKVLNPKNSVHKGVIENLKTYNLINNKTFLIELPKSDLTLKDKDKEKDKAKVKEKAKEKVKAKDKCILNSSVNLKFKTKKKRESRREKPKNQKQKTPSPSLSVLNSEMEFKKKNFINKSSQEIITQPVLNSEEKVKKESYKNKTSNQDLQDQQVLNSEQEPENKISKSNTSEIVQASLHPLQVWIKENAQEVGILE